MICNTVHNKIQILTGPGDAGLDTFAALCQDLLRNESHMVCTGLIKTNEATLIEQSIFPQNKRCQFKKHY